MIVKKKDSMTYTTRFEKAGAKAEKDMAHFLKREFANDKNIWVFHDFRFRIDKDDFAQIDHLVMHRFGFVIVESKSVCDSVEVNKFGEWTRWFNKKPSGMPSPVEQAKRQAKALREKLQGNRSTLRRKGMGFIQLGFKFSPIDVLIAISTKGRITGAGRARFKDEVLKADMVCPKIREIIDPHKKVEEWVPLNNDECIRVVRYLKKLHTPVENNAHSNDQMVYKKPQRERAAQVAEPSSVRKTDTKPSDYWVCTCGHPFEVRHKHSFYRYCSKCKKRLALSPKCPECEEKAILSQTEGTRIITYVCMHDPGHQGVFRANQTRYKKDESTLGANS